MPVRRVAALLVCAAAVGVLAAACGSGSRPVYTAKASAKCLGDKGFKNVSSNPLKVGFIAGTAENGGLQARAPNGNVLTIAFAGDEAGAKATERAFREHATPFYKRHMSDIMETQRNAVLVWTTSPTQLELANALGCLAS